MKLEPGKNRLGSNIEIHKPMSFSDDFGPIAYEIDKTFVVYCVDHRKIAGHNHLRNALSKTITPEKWCSGCAVLAANKELEEARREAALIAKEVARELRWDTTADEVARDDERRRRRELGIARNIGKGAPTIARLRKEREERLQRVEAARALAAEIVAQEIAEGKDVPRWKRDLQTLSTPHMVNRGLDLDSE